MWSPTRRRRRALALTALSWATGLVLGAAPALATGPGVRLTSDSDSAAVVDISGQQIADWADVRSQSYTLRSNSSGAGQKLTLTGLSIRGLLQRAGFNPDTVQFISIARDDGSIATLKQADFAYPPPFPEGPALVTEEGNQTRYFRPVRGPSSTNARDNIVVSADSGAIDMTVGGGALLAVRASAKPRTTAVGRTVRFSAHVRFPPPGASFTYQWDFGDGTGGSGATATHVYTQDGDYQAQVTVDGTGGTGAVCQETCGGVAAVDVRVGKRRTAPRPDTQQGSGGSGAGGTGGTGSGSGSGSGGSGSGADSGSTGGSDTGAQAPRDRGKPAPAANAGDLITGVLLANSPTALKNSLPALARAGGQSAAARATREGAAGGGTLGGSVALTLVLVMLGALYERRRGTLRLA